MTDSPRVARRKQSAPPVPEGAELPRAEPSRLSAAAPSKGFVAQALAFVLDVLSSSWS